MKCRRGRVLGAVLGIALAMTQIPGIVSQAAWMPDHQIPAYQQKDIFSTDTVTISYVKQGANGEEETVAVEAQEVEVQGSAVEKTMTVTLPNAEKYSEALQWIIKVSDTQNGDYYASQKISIKSASTEPENPDPNPGNGQDDNNDNHNGNGNGNSNNKNNTTNNKNGKTDVKKNNPQTGDTANIAMPIIGIGFAVLLLALAMILRKKSVENCR